MIDARDGLLREINRRGVKQVALSECTGLTPQQISDILNKRRKLNANELFDFCRGLGITPNDVFRDELDRPVLEDVKEPTAQDSA